MLAVIAAATLTAGIPASPAAASGTWEKFWFPTGEAAAQLTFFGSDSGTNANFCVSIPGNTPAGTGSKAPQVTAWTCGSNLKLQTWVLTLKPGSHTDFSLWNSATAGCLDDWGGATSNGSAIRLYGPTNGVCNNASQTWSIWEQDGDSNATHYLAPASSNPNTMTQVVSITGTVPVKGAGLHFWKAFTSLDDQWIISW
jgi:hypothetical protein